jgi:putative ABC transport system substrate-binding protein
MSLTRSKIAALLLLLALGGADAAAQSPQRQVRVAYVWLFQEGPSAPYHAEFRARLGELGWKEGPLMRTELYDANGDFTKLDAIMAELVRSKVDVIVAMCTPEAKAALRHTSTIPIVVAAAGDLVAAGLVKNLSKPGGNLTGVQSMLLPLSAKRIAFMKELLPSLKRATVVWNPERPDNAPEVAIMQKSATQLGIELQSVQVRTREEVATALEMLAVDGTQAIFTTGDNLLGQQSGAIIRRAAELRLPGMYEERRWPDHGGLMSYGANVSILSRWAAEYVDRILRGEKAGDLPIQQPTRFELVINRKAANAQNFRLPQALLIQADEIID